MGSYGYVYQVRESAPLSRILALKVLRIDQFNEQALSNFRSDAERIAKLQHPNILRIYQFGQLADKPPYLVMENAPRTIYYILRKQAASRSLVIAGYLL